MGPVSDKKGQDRKRISERYRKNCKVGRQTSECKATLVWTRKKERKRLREKTLMEMAVPGRRKRGKPRRRWMDLVRETWKGLELGKETKMIERNGEYCRAVATSNREKPKEEAEEGY